VDSWSPIKALTLPATGVADVVSFTVASVNVEDSVLRALGINMRLGAPRNVLTGVTTAYNVYMLAGDIASIPYTFTISSTPLSTVSYPGSFVAVGSGTTYSFVDQWSVPNKLATVWTVHDENYDNAYWRNLAGVPQGSILVANNDSKSMQVPMTASYSTAGYTLKRFSNAPALGFGAPTLRRKHSDVKEDFVIVKQSGKVAIVGGVVAKTDGGVESKSNVINMGEEVPSNLKLVSKFTLVESVIWGVGVAPGEVLSYYEAPFDLIKGLVMKSAFSRYVYFRSDIVLRVQLQTNAFMNGSIVVAWGPLCNSGQALSLYNGNLRSLSVAKQMVMYAGACSTSELRVPYVNVKDHLDLRVQTEDNIMGTFVVYVVNALRVGAAATAVSATLTVSVAFENSDFAVINPTAVSIVAQGGIQSKVTNINVQGSVAGTLDASTGSDNFQGGSTTAPMDLPNIGTNYMPTNDRAYPVVCNTANLAFSQVLNTNADTRPMVKPVDVGTTEDEMSFKYLQQKMSFIESFVLSVGNVMGEALFVADLCPAFELFNLPYEATFTPTLLSYVSFPFSFWRGSLVYKIVVVANPVHTARLQICSHVGYEASGLTVDEAFGQYVCVFEVCGVSEITVSFPWRSPTEWKKVNNGSNVDTTNYSMGQWSLRVLNPLQAPETVSQSVDVNIYYCGGPDYETTYVGNNAADLSPIGSLV